MSKKCRIQLRRDTAGQLSAENPVLESGEPAFETDTNTLKVGDGSTVYNSLSQVGGSGSGPTNAIVSNTAGIANSNRIVNIVSISQADYDNLSSYDNNTLYFLADVTTTTTTTTSTTTTTTTTAAPASTFFSEDWESGTNGWTTVDDPAMVNQWEVGTAAYNSGSQGAYISNDGGTTNAYTNTDTGQCHIYKSFTSPADISTGVTMKWDWKGVGEGGFDNLKVYIAPSGTTPVAGTDVSGMYRIGMYYAGSSTYVTETENVGFDVTAANTEYVLIFSWKNDSSGGSNPPISIDNISIYTN